MKVKLNDKQLSETKVLDQPSIHVDIYNLFAYNWYLRVGNIVIVQGDHLSQMIMKNYK